MKMQLMFIAAALSVASVAHATTNFFTPISGSAFVSQTNSPSVQRGNAIVYSIDTSSTQRIEASLGHALGGTNGFTFYGSNGGHTLTCWVVVLDHSGAAQFFAGSTTANGAFNFFIETTPASGDYFYTAMCDLPAKVGSATGAIYGVAPDH